MGMTWRDRCLSGVAIGPLTNRLQREVRELALGSLVDHGAQQICSLDMLQHIRSFTTDQGVEA